MKEKQGRKPVADPKKHRVTVNMNSQQYGEFKVKFEHSGVGTLSQYVMSCIFGYRMKVVKVDKATMDYYMRLTTIYEQIQKIGVNYNQITRMINTIYSEKKALAFLAKVVRSHEQLMAEFDKIQLLTEEFERQWLQK